MPRKNTPKAAKKRTASNESSPDPGPDVGAVAAAPGLAAGAAAAPAVDVTAVGAGQQAALLVAERIVQELPLILDPLERTDLRLHRDDARTVAADLRQIEIDLVASGTIVARLSGPEVIELVRLAEDLDESIIRSKLVVLALDTVGEILESAVRVKDIVSA